MKKSYFDFSLQYSELQTSFSNNLHQFVLKKKEKENFKALFSKVKSF